ncbi:MAG: hypothetical protein J6W28_08640 [Clostridia bacterium]|nr:hypothetical protein [Clostridia bacterium]
MDERKELFFTHLEEYFEPKEAFSPYGLKSKWRVVPVGTAEYDGSMLSSLGGTPMDVRFDPKLKGWYKIYIHAPGGSVLGLKLTKDPAPFAVGSTAKYDSQMEEFLWRAADMTGQAITLTRSMYDEEYVSMLAALRFVPMGEEEVAAFLREAARPDTKRIYATDDMHAHYYYTKLEKVEDFLPAVLQYQYSDVEWLSVEQIKTFISLYLPTEDPDDFCFPSPGDKRVQKQFGKFDYDEVLKRVVAQGKEIGLKMSVSLRMGAWGMRYRYDQFYFENSFIQTRPELRTHDRNGDEIMAMSYAYPEVRRYMIDTLLDSARSGCDAVTLIAHRGIPYVLFEKPVADRFYELYGEYPYELPLDDPRLNRLHCDIMTGFFREVREALDIAYGKGKIQVHLRTNYSVHSTKYVGIDVEELAKEGLIDAIISYPHRIYEKLDGDVWQDEGKTRIDLEKYSKYVRQVDFAVARSCDFTSLPPFDNQRGEKYGPADLDACVQEWMSIEERYGTKVYIDIMPRHMENEEFKQRALRLYKSGAERIGLWDTYERVFFRAAWSTSGRLGHKEELASMEVGEGEYYRRFRIYRYGEKDFNRYSPNFGG